MNNISILRDFKILIFSLISLLLIIAIWFTAATYRDYSNKILDKITNSAGKIENILSNDFDYINYQMEYIGKQISNKEDDYNHIYEILKTYQGKHQSNIATSWNMFSWVTKDSYLVVDGDVGIMKNPIYMKSRDYMPLTISNPGKIIFGVPVLGAVSRQWLIPAGFGVIDSKGIYKGTIIFGFDITSLYYKLEKIVNDSNIKFFLIDKNNKEISPLSNVKYELSEKIRLWLSVIQHDKMKQVISTQGFMQKNSSFSLYYPLKKYDFAIVVEYDNETFYKDFLYSWLYRMAELSIIVMFILLVFYILYKKIILPINQLGIIAERIAKGEKNVVIPDYPVKEIYMFAEQIRQVASYTDILEKNKNNILHANTTLIEAFKEQIFEKENRLIINEKFLHSPVSEVKPLLDEIIIKLRDLSDKWSKFNEKSKEEIIVHIYTTINKLFYLTDNENNFIKGPVLKKEETLSRVDIVSQIKEIVEVYKTLYLSNKYIKLTVIEPLHKIPLLMVYKKEIEYVIKTLLLNSIKYTDTKKIEVSFEMRNFTSGKRNKGLCVKISNQCTKMFEEDSQVVFDNKKLNSTLNGEWEESKNFSFSIAKELINMHAGEIWGENNKDGVGISFYFILPID